MTPFETYLHGRTNMNETRQEIKAKARDLVMKDQAAFVMLTLVFLVLTDWISTILQLIRANPLTEAMNTFSESVHELTQQALDSGAATVPDLQPAYNAAFFRAREIFADRFTLVIVFLYVLVFLYSVIMSYGYFRCAMTHAREGQADRQELFSMFYLAGRILVMEFIVTGITLIAFSFFFLPGIYFYYAYYMAPYCLIDHPEESFLHAMGRSMKMMRGHKLEMCMCDLSFVGWMLLSLIITNTMANFGNLAGPVAAELMFLLSATVMNGYIMPYRQLTVTLYYDSFRMLQNDTVSA